MKLFMLVLSLFVLTGCATTANYEKLLTGWVGADADQLAWVWGPPASVYPLSTGDKLLTYVNSTTTSGYTASDPTLNIVATVYSTSFCKTDFLVDKQSNKISGWHWTGQDCKINNSGRPVDKAFRTSGWSKPSVK